MLNLLFFSLVILVPHYILPAAAAEEDPKAELLRLAGGDPQKVAESLSDFLMRAIELQKVESVKDLIFLKADVNKPCSTGHTPLMAAAVCLNAEIVTLLIAAGANASSKSKKGNTAVQMASLLAKQDPSNRGERAKIVNLLKLAVTPVKPELAVTPVKLEPKKKSRSTFGRLVSIIANMKL